MSTGIVKSEKSSPNSVDVFWTIKHFDMKVEENDVLRSVPFYFAGQMWQLLLTTLPKRDDRIYFSISRITVSKDETPNSQVVCWNMGILDCYWRHHYGGSGFASLAMVSKWAEVADFGGPKFKDLRLKKDMYMPGDQITIAVRLILDSSHELIKVEAYPADIEHQIITHVVVINVKGKTFYAECSILNGISHDVELKIPELIRGSMTVIDLPDCDPDAFECFLSFKESGEFEGLTDDISLGKTREVYDIADKFQVPELKSECVLRFLRDLDVSSVCGFLEMAERYHDRELKEECSEFFLKNARKILNTSGWLEFMAKRTKFANVLFISYLDSIAS